MKVLVLDDYLGIARGSADWTRLGHDAEVRVLQDHLADREALVRELRPFDVIVAMRERTPFPAALLEALPNLRLLVTTGTRNNSIDLAACERLGITVCAAPGDASGSAPAELAWALILALVKRIPMEHQAVLAGRWQTGTTGLVAGKRQSVPITLTAVEPAQAVYAIQQQWPEAGAWMLHLKGSCSSPKAEASTLVAVSKGTFIREKSEVLREPATKKQVDDAVAALARSQAYGSLF